MIERMNQYLWRMHRTLFLFVFSILLVSSHNITAQNPSVDELLGKIDPAGHHDFVRVDHEHTSKPEIYMRKAAYKAFCAMADSAKKAGIHLEIISATRSFQHQKAIWERKWSAPKYMGWSALDKALDILNYSSMPGSSRHHWGTDIDLNALNNNYFASGEGKQVYDWLSLNAPDFGFVQVYTDQSTGRTGYNEEKWHWSYLPLSEPFLEAYNHMISTGELHGFEGAQVADSLSIIQHYVNGISTHPFPKN